MKYLILALFFLISISTKAQVPANIGFENNDLTGWKSYISGDPNNCQYGNTGSGLGIINCMIQPSNSNPFPPLVTCSDSGYNFQIFSNSRIMVVNDSSKIFSTYSGSFFSGVDPYSNLPIVCPNIPNNMYSLKLGNDVTNDSAESVKTKFKVNNQNQFLTVRYAAVLQNGGHSFCEQPRLEFVLYDLGTNSTPVFIKDTFSLIIPTPDSNSISSGWFKSNIVNDVLCSNWFPFTFDLTPYYQHNVEISLTLADCALGGHFGYAYIDIDTLNYPQAKFCKGDTKATLIAPSGYANYIWDSVGNTGNPILVGNYDTLIISNPRIETQYKVSYKSPYSSEWRTFYYNLAKGCPQTGVESNTKFANNNFYVYPNPAKNNLTIIGDNLQNTKIELLDLLGRKINYQTISNSSKEIQIDISLLSSQMYFIRTTKDNGVINTIKFFKE